MVALGTGVTADARLLEDATVSDDPGCETSAEFDFRWRRLSIHWDANAGKARFAAYVLWRMHGGAAHEELARECGMGADSDLGVWEGFQREAALALELVVKARIARQMRTRDCDPATDGLPANHRVPELWRQAGLPDLSDEDRYRLRLAQSILEWSGRYPTPKSAEKLEQEYNDFGRLPIPGTPLGDTELPIHKAITLDWESFDRLYQIALEAK